MHDYYRNNWYKFEDGFTFDGVHYPGRNDIFPPSGRGAGKGKARRVVDAEVAGTTGAGGNGGSGNIAGGNGGSGGGGRGGNITGGNIHGDNGNGGIPDAKTGRPWYKNPWILGGGVTTATVGGGAALYNYASNKAKETTAAAPTPGGGSNNKNDSNNTPTPNESPESESWWDSILEWVQENPELAMLILAGGGFAGGALLAR